MHLRRGVALAGIGLLIVGGMLTLWHFASGPAIQTLEVDKDLPARRAQDDEEAAGLCPWRQPQDDLKRFFPGATRTEDQMLVLSRKRALVARYLGRMPTAQENALRIHRVTAQGADARQTRGTIVTRCVAGHSGVIELVMAVDTTGKVIGVRLQRLREPDVTTTFLQSSPFLSAFHGKTIASSWKLHVDFPAAPAGSAVSAQAVLDGARTALVLMQVGEQANP